jgi:hypothetical protein
MIKFQIFLILIITQIKSNIIIPFRIIDHSINNTVSEENNFFLFNKFLSEIEIGTPPQLIEVQISGNNYGIFLKEGVCSSNQCYNKKYSSSLIEKNHCGNTNIYSFYKEIGINESIVFKSDNDNMKNQLKIKKFPLLYFKEFSQQEKVLVQKYGRKIELYEDLYEIFNLKNNSLEKTKDGKASLLIGLQLSSSYNCIPRSNFISLLKDNNIIKDSNFVFQFYNNNNQNSDNYDGELIIGTLPHEYSPENYHEQQFSISNVLNYKYLQDWEIQFKNIYFFKQENNVKEQKNNIDIINNENTIIVDNNVNIEFNFDVRIIFGTKNYYNIINEYFFIKNKDKCSYNIIEKYYGIFICNNDVNIDKFPTLFFYNHIYNYTFELNNKDLFEEKNNKKYFLIAFDHSNIDRWTFGTLFLKKYCFVFNTIEKTIGFYNKDITFNNKNKILKVIYNLIYFILILIVGIGGFLLGKKVYVKVRAKKIYELNDNFIYKATEDPQIALEMATKK